MRELSIWLFGAPQVTRAGVPVTFDTRKALALLGYLAVTGRAHRREHLAALLWPESDQARARAALRRTLSVAGAVGPALLLTRGEVALDPALTWCDVDAFVGLADSDDPLDWQRAVELAPDPLMAGFTLRDAQAFDDWLASTADQLKDRLAAVLARTVVSHQSSGHLDLALPVAQRWVALDALSEPAHRAVMQLLAWSGQRPAALRQYRVCVRILDRELGVPPLPETTELYDDIRANRLTPPAATTGLSGSQSEGAEGSPSRSVVSAGDNVPSAGSDVSTADETLIGRESELLGLERRWRAAAREPSACAIVGASGLGRTALVTHLQGVVEAAGGRVVVVRGHAGESDLAFAALADLARSLVIAHPRLADSLAAVGQPVDTPGALIRLFDTVLDAVAVALDGPVPGLLTVDDAHWLDPSSAELLAYLFRRPPSGVLMVMTGRSDLPLPVSTSDFEELFTLQPWAVDQVAAVLTRLQSPQLDAVLAHRRTLGIPRLVTEYAAAARAGISSTDTQQLGLVVSRLDAAPATTRQLLGTVAVLGTVSEPELLRLTSGRDETEIVDAIEDAVARQLLVEDATRGGYDFPYDALRDLVLGRVSLARQRLLHGRAADAVARRHGQVGRSVSAAVVARHLAASGRDDEAGRWYWTAAAESRQLYAHREALEHLRAALALGYDPAAVHGASGDALVRLGHYHDALGAYEQAAAAVESLDNATLAELEHKLAEVHDRLGEWAVAQAHLESAADLLCEVDDLPRLAQVSADLALVRYRQGDADAAMAEGERARRLAERSEDQAALAQAYNVLGVVAVGAGELDQALQLLVESREHARAASDIQLTVAAMNNLARALERHGRIDDALSEAEGALALGVQQGDRHREAALHDHVADLLHQAGRDDEAMEHLKVAATAFADVDDASMRPDVWKLVAW